MESIYGIQVGILLDFKNMPLISSCEILGFSMWFPFVFLIKCLHDFGQRFFVSLATIQLPEGRTKGFYDHICYHIIFQFSQLEIRGIPSSVLGPYKDPIFFVS